MRPPALPAYVSPDWTIRASDYQFRLTSGAPFDAHIARHAQPTPMGVSIHDGLEVGVLLAGRHRVHQDGRQMEAVPGDVWLVSMWEPHAWRVVAPHTMEVTVIFLPEFVGEGALGEVPWLSFFACDPCHRPVVSSPETRATVLEAGWESAVRLNLLRILFALGRNWCPPPEARPGLRLGTPALARIMPALAEVHQEPARRVTLEDAAAACSLSPAHFARVFRQTMGISFGKLRARSRLAYVARRLVTTELPVAALAREAGFADVSHLCRAFSGRYQCSAGEYRRWGLRTVTAAAASPTESGTVRAAAREKSARPRGSR